MARPKVSQDKKKSVIFTIRFSPEEQQKLDEMAAICGMSSRRFAREKILRGSPPKPKMPKIDIATYTELKKIGVNINQMARLVNSGRLPHGYQKTLSGLSEQLQFIIRLLLQ